MTATDHRPARCPESVRLLHFEVWSDLWTVPPRAPIGWPVTRHAPASFIAHCLAESTCQWQWRIRPLQNVYSPFVSQYLTPRHKTVGRSGGGIPQRLEIYLSVNTLSTLTTDSGRMWAFLVSFYCRAKSQRKWLLERCWWERFNDWIIIKKTRDRTC